MGANRPVGVRGCSDIGKDLLVRGSLVAEEEEEGLVSMSITTTLWFPLSLVLEAFSLRGFFFPLPLGRPLFPLLPLSDLRRSSICFSFLLFLLQSCITSQHMGQNQSLVGMDSSGGERQKIWYSASHMSQSMVCCLSCLEKQTRQAQKQQVWVDSSSQQ